MIPISHAVCTISFFSAGKRQLNSNPVEVEVSSQRAGIFVLLYPSAWHLVSNQKHFLNKWMMLIPLIRYSIKLRESKTGSGAPTASQAQWERFYIQSLPQTHQMRILTPEDKEIQARRPVCNSSGAVQLGRGNAETRSMVLTPSSSSSSFFVASAGDGCSERWT